MKAERTWLEEEINRLGAQLSHVQYRFVTLEQVQALADRMAEKLKVADFKAKRFVFQALETRVTVALDGAVDISFSIPLPEGEVVSAAPGLD